jgi:hypothetical protein
MTAKAKFPLKDSRHKGKEGEKFVSLNLISVLATYGERV